ncbi:MAG: alanine racemase [Clostridiales bacterium]
MSYQNEDFWIEVNLDNLIYNYQEIKKKISGQKGVMAVVKAQAYGHGLLATAQALAKADVDYLAVSHFGEARELRVGGIKSPILMMAPSLPQYYKEILSLNLAPTLDNAENLEHLSEAAAEKECFFHLKINTGMNRFGINAEDIPDFFLKLKEYPNLKIASVFSHLPTALIQNHPQTQKQIDTFDGILQVIRSYIDYNFDVHLSNSAASISHPEARYDYVRVGTLLYGQFPAPFLKGTLNLKDTWQGKAKIVEVREVKTGEKVGYGGDFTAKKPMRLGVIPVGYTDGFGIQPPLNNISLKIFIRQALKLLRSFLRRRPNNIVYFEQKPLAVIGRIAMQTTVISLDNTDAKVGTVVDVPLRRTAVASSVKKIYKGSV